MQGGDAAVALAVVLVAGEGGGGIEADEAVSLLEAFVCVEGAEAGVVELELRGVGVGDGGLDGGWVAERRGCEW